jgi:6-phosphogluconate dehydrogenase
LLAEIKDKVVQDADESEGTGVWTSEEGMRLHIPIPTIAAAHQFRLASAYSSKRARVSQAIGGDLAKHSKIDYSDKSGILEDLRQATYAAFLASFVQGLTLLARMDAEKHWGLNFENILTIWRSGCIIRSEYISKFLLSVYKEADSVVLSDPLCSQKVAGEFKKAFPALKRVVLKATEADDCIPSVSATLEFLKYSTTKDDLPTEFMEAELDYFGHHQFEFKGEDSGKPEKG